MTDYYVSYTLGNNSYPGTELQPWQTISKVNSGSYSPDDTINFKRGDTWTGEQLTPPDSGSSGQPIIFRAYGTGADPIFDANSAVNYCIYVNNKDYLTFQNIEIHSGMLANFFVSHLNTNDIILNNITSSGGTTSGIYVTGSHYQVDLTNCTANADNGSCTYGIRYDTAYGTISGCEASGCDTGIRVNTSDYGNITVTQCSVHDNTTNGIQFIGDTSSSYTVTFKRCAIFDNATGFNGASNVQDVSIEYCKIYTNTSYGIIANANGTPDDIEIRNCTFYDNGAPGLYTDIDDTLFYNNICQDNDDDSNNWQVQITGTPSTWDFDYNWYYDSGTTTNRLGLFNYTTIANWRSALGSPNENNSDYDNPDMVNPASDDFTLQSYSPCVDAGYDWGQTEDYDGNGVSNSVWDVGCLELQQAVTGLGRIVDGGLVDAGIIGGRLIS